MTEQADGPRKGGEAKVDPELGLLLRECEVFACKLNEAYEDGDEDGATGTSPNGIDAHGVLTSVDFSARRIREEVPQSFRYPLGSRVTGTAYLFESTVSCKAALHDFPPDIQSFIRQYWGGELLNDPETEYKMAYEQMYVLGTDGTFEFECDIHFYVNSDEVPDPSEELIVEDDEDETRVGPQTEITTADEIFAGVFNTDELAELGGLMVNLQQELAAEPNYLLLLETQKAEVESFTRKQHFACVRGLMQEIPLPIRM